MKTSFDTNEILYGLLKDNRAGNNGGCYEDGDRPENSQKEDITYNTISLTQEHLPQIGRSNVNIYVPDSYVSIEGDKQYKKNSKRLKALSTEIMGILRSANLPGLKVVIEDQKVLRFSDINQHCVNIRLFWNIQN